MGGHFLAIMVRTAQPWGYSRLISHFLSLSHLLDLLGGPETSTLAPEDLPPKVTFCQPRATFVHSRHDIGGSLLAGGMLGCLQTRVYGRVRVSPGGLGRHIGRDIPSWYPPGRLEWHISPPSGPIWEAIMAHIPPFWTLLGG